MEANYKGYHVTKEGMVFNKFGKVMKANDNGRGYLIVGITHEKKKMTKAIHRLVAEVYLPNPQSLSDVDHIDSNKRNNDLSNLRWLSHGQNIKHSFDSNMRSARGSSNARAILNEVEVHKICRLLQSGLLPAEIRNLGYPYIPVRGIKARNNWTFISKHYLF